MARYRADIPHVDRKIFMTSSMHGVAVRHDIGNIVTAAVHGDVHRTRVKVKSEQSDSLHVINNNQTRPD